MTMQSTESNLSAFLYGPGDVRFEEQPIPTLEGRPYDVLIKIAYTGVCGSDVHFWTNGGINEKVRPGNPMILGHEASGVVSAIGTNVTKLAIGDLVALEPGFPCRRCDFCLGGKYNFCPDMTFAASPGPGPVAHGTLTTFFRLPEDFCYKVPSHVGLDEAVLIEPLAVATQAAKLVGIKMGDVVVVFGAGTVGLMACAVARASGASVVVSVDINKERLAFARDSVADATYQADPALSAAENAAALRSTCGIPEGADIIIEATGVASSVQTGISVIKKGGSYIQVGLGRPMIEFPLVEMSEKEITMKGIFRYGPGAFALAVDMVARKKIELKPFITKVVEFEEAVEAWETAKKGEGIKTLIRARQEA